MSHPYLQQEGNSTTTNCRVRDLPYIDVYRLSDHANHLNFTIAWFRNFALRLGLCGHRAHELFRDGGSEPGMALADRGIMVGLATGAAMGTGRIAGDFVMRHFRAASAINHFSKG